MPQCPISHIAIGLALPVRNPRTQNTARMREIIEAEQEPDDSDLRRHRHQKKAGKRKREVLSDPEDGPYSLSTASSDSDSKTESDSSVQIMPDEVCLTPVCYRLQCHGPLT